MRLMNKLRRIFTLERLIWGGATLLLAALFLTVGLTAPSIPGFERRERVKVVYVDDGASVPAASEDDTSAVPSVTDKIPLNSATKEQLMTVKGVGEVFAERILTYREENGGFADIAELKNIRGIGDSRYEKWKEYFTVD